jgi:hypothetical protein
MAVDTKRHDLVIVGQDRVVSYDLDAADIKGSRQVWSTTGDQNLESNYYKGLAYDPVADKFVGINKACNVYILDPETKAWTSRTPSGNPPYMDHLAGIYSLWRYVPSVNAYIFQTYVDEDVHFYKFTAGPGQTGTNTQGRGQEAGFSVEAAPNPFNPAVTISVRAIRQAAPTLTIYDTHGRIVHTASMTRDSYVWNAASLSTGVYLLKVTASGISLAKRLLLQK